MRVTDRPTNRLADDELMILATVHSLLLLLLPPLLSALLQGEQQPISYIVVSPPETQLGYAADD